MEYLYKNYNLLNYKIKLINIESETCADWKPFFISQVKFWKSYSYFPRTFVFLNLKKYIEKNQWELISKYTRWKDTTCW